MAAKKQAGGKSMTKWDEELAKRASIAMGMEEHALGVGSFISTRGGILTYRDNAVPGNKMNVVILDHVLEYVWYREKFDPDNPQNPDAFALGRDERTITWHENSDPEYAGKLCKDSDILEWGSADTGNGKAAKQSRRLIMITEDALKDIPNAQPAMIKVPVTSVKAWAGYVKNLLDTLKRPPLGVITEISLIPDPKTQFKMQFKLKDSVPNSALEALFKKADDVQEQLMQPYQPHDDEADSDGGGKGRAKSAKRGAGKATAKATRKAPAKAARRGR